MTTVADAYISTMTKNSLIRAGYISMDDVCLAGTYELLRISQLGRKSLAEIEEWAKANGKVACDERFRLERAVFAMEQRINLMQRDLADAKAKLVA